MKPMQASAVFAAALSVLVGTSPLMGAPIVADHEAVNAYADIPTEYIELVKAMWLNVPGESHSSGYRLGLELLAGEDSRFAVSVADGGSPEGATDLNLRVSRATWGDVDHAAGWRYGYGEEDWYTSATAIERTKAHLDYAHAQGLPIAAMGFGWCWDMTWQNAPGGGVDPVYQVSWAGSSEGGPDGSLRWGLDADDFALTSNHVSLDTYLDATQEYVDHAATQGYDTVVFFTTGPVDGGGNTGENGYQRHLKNERIRDYVNGSSNLVLFDYADILCWSDAGAERTTSWTDHGDTPRQYPVINSDNMLDLGGSYSEDGDHIGQRGALRLGKALWWLLARIAGWQGEGDTDTSSTIDTEDTSPDTSSTIDTEDTSPDTSSGTQTHGDTDNPTGSDALDSDTLADTDANDPNASNGCSCRTAGTHAQATQSLVRLLTALQR
ncbi:MAG: MSCRAMM family adhesin SdrC [Myxococcota bacterium]|jgi:hypothetical protein|nr:MSCRAMM family adhesin SdrC [Myxococcota bacterium]